MEVQNIIREMEELQEKVSDRQTSKAKLEGQIKQVEQELESSFGVKTLAQAEQLIRKKIKMKEKIEEEIQQEYARLKEEYEW